MSKGFIKISRKFFEHRYWTEPREYSRAEAWLDLIQSARFEASTVLLNGRELEVRPGELIASRRFLEKRWGWGSTKVGNFLEMLKSNQKITIEQTNGRTIIKLCNYESYNDQQTNEQTTGKPLTNQRQTRDKPKEKKDKERKELEEYKEKDISKDISKKKGEADASSLTQARDFFYASLIPYVSGSSPIGKYSKEMIRQFYDYWTELNPSGTKMRWQLEKTWELPKRLARWARTETPNKRKNNFTEPLSHEYEEF